MLVKIASNAFEIESVRTYVPLIVATPEDDRESRSGRSRSLRPQSARKRDPDHVPISSIAAITVLASERGRSLTISPSSRKRIRSAIAAARASCVTITVVWP